MLFRSTLTVTGFSSESLDGMSKVSLNVPAAAGEKRTVNVQLSDGITVSPEQLSFRMINSSVSGLARAILPIKSSALPAFVTVTVLSDELPSVISPKGIRRSSTGGTESVMVISAAGGGGGWAITTVTVVTLKVRQNIPVKNIFVFPVIIVFELPK